MRNVFLMLFITIINAQSQEPLQITFPGLGDTLVQSNVYTLQWAGSTDSVSYIYLYKGFSDSVDFICEVNNGIGGRQFSINTTWGTGGDFRIKLHNTITGNDIWSGPFFINSVPAMIDATLPKRDK